MPKRRCPVVKIATPPQMTMFVQEGPSPSERTHTGEPVRFVQPDPREIFIGGRRLDEYLRDSGQEWPLKVRTFMGQRDYSKFVEKYKSGGRPPYAPVLMLSLVLYGLMKAVTSLRGLEQLARMDLGCMWVSGGIAPDHSGLGRFLLLHSETLTESFFEELTRQVLKEVGGDSRSVAGDGTVIQAAASRLNLLKAEAAADAAREAREAAAGAVGDEAVAEKARRAEEVAGVAMEREQERRKKGRATSGGLVNPCEPEAVVQPLKSGQIAPSYKGSVLANVQRVIVAQHVDPSSEVAAVGPMLKQAARTGEGPVAQASFDAGYFSGEVLGMAVEQNIDVVCPEGKAQQEGDWEKHSTKQFPKVRFTYDEESDTYRCPAGEQLRVVGRFAGNEKVPGYKKYQATACEDCPLRAQCTSGQGGRSIKRYAGDELKEAQRQVMKQEGARQRYRKRQGMVEPVFSALKGVQGLRRFMRRGLGKVRLEFSLHACAYNLRRWLQLMARAGTGRTAAFLWMILVVVYPWPWFDPAALRRHGLRSVPLS
jgi:transposase